MMNGYWGLGMASGAVLMILFWVGVILLTLWGFRLLFPDRPLAPISQATSALEIAQLRYSCGEISQAEYLALVKDPKQSKETIK